MDNWARLGEAITRRRAYLGYTTRQQFADGTGFPAKTLSDLEKHRRDNFDLSTYGRLERALEWPNGSIEAILAGGQIPFEVTPPAASPTWHDVFPKAEDLDVEHTGPRSLGPAFDLDASLAADVEITDQARRLSWLTGPDSPIGEVGARRLATAVEAVMAMTLPQGLPRRAEQVQVPPMSPGRRPAGVRTDR